MTEPMITFRTAGTILFGPNSIERIGEIVHNEGVRRLAVVTDKGLVRCGLLDRLVSLLGGVSYSVYDEIEETPSLETIRKAADSVGKENPDLLIGFGGGSPMDAAKAVSILLTNGGDIKSYLGRDTVRLPGIKKILISTTAGTGSEVTLFSVLSEKAGDLQILTGIADHHLLPEVAIVDPTLTVGMPATLTANTGIDAFSHAAESYLNVRSNFQTEPLALRSIQVITGNLEKAASDGTDSQARREMSAGSLLAGMSLSQTGGGLAHALAETIQIPYRLPHGTAIAVILPEVMSFNLVTNAKKYADVARAMGISDGSLSEKDLALASVDRVRAIVRCLGLPERISDLGIPRKDLPKIAKWTTEFAPSLLRVNPRTPTGENLLEILEKAY